MLNNPPIFNASITPQGRLTLTTVTPVLSATVSAATTAFYTPYVGNLVPLFDGVNMIPTACAELSNVSTNSATGSAGPAAVGASKVNDLFVWLNAGVPTLTRSPDWTNTTTRGFTLTRQNGILLNTTAITNGPAALRGTYVGTIASNAGSTWDYIFGAAGAPPTAAVLNVWNAYNRVSTSTNVTDTTAPYAYATATIRQANASAGNQISFVRGLAEDGVVVDYAAQLNTSAAANANPLVGLGLDSTTTFSGLPGAVFATTAAVYAATPTPAMTWSPGIGVHTLSANEKGDGANNNSFNASSLNTLSATLRN